MILSLPAALAAQVEKEARAAFPRECCGLVEGVRTGGHAAALALHPVRNLSADAAHFVLDPAAHLRLARAARAAGRGIIGCYHSHPNGAASPSSDDAEGAGEVDFLWLIAAVAQGRVTLGSFVWTGTGFVPVIRQ
jgi:proteasome lid subunit RPN8/RPN11